MTVIEKTINVEQDKASVFEKLFESNDGIFNAHMKIMEWKTGEWRIKKKVRQRKEQVYIYIDSLPDDLKQYTLENDKYLRLEVKNKFIVDTEDYQKIKTKFKIVNLNKLLRTILNDLHIVNIKSTVELHKVDNTHTSVKIIIKVQLNIPKSKIVDEYINVLANNLLDSTISQLA